MNDPIERQDAINEAEQWIKIYSSGRGGQRERDAIKHVISGIKKLPSAQPEIIRCKDCKHYVLRALFGQSQGMCERLCKYDNSFSMLTEDDDFCSYAERRKQ